MGGGVICFIILGVLIGLRELRFLVVVSKSLGTTREVGVPNGPGASVAKLI